ncbi:N-acetylmuramoyl-L-alanine amidase [Streptomyces scopuliridis]|uniref:N-acetylmuramoyl-L-alanine amidase n=1 Tax=Streptomyces scopuliridis TaxID=452529 RepID=UPI0035D6D08D
MSSKRARAGSTTGSTRRIAGKRSVWLAVGAVVLGGTGVAVVTVGSGEGGDDLESVGSARPASSHTLALGGADKYAIDLPRTDTEAFSLIGVSWKDRKADFEGTAQIRTRDADSGQWREWRDLEFGVSAPETSEGDTAGVRGASEPLWVGPSDAVEVRGGAKDKKKPLPGGARLDMIDPGTTAKENGKGKGGTKPAHTKAPGKQTTATTAPAPSGEPDASPSDIAPEDGAATDGGPTGGTEGTGSTGTTGGGGALEPSAPAEPGDGPTTAPAEEPTGAPSDSTSGGTDGGNGTDGGSSTDEASGGTTDGGDGATGEPSATPTDSADGGADSGADSGPGGGSQAPTTDPATDPDTPPATAPVTDPATDPAEEPSGGPAPDPTATEEDPAASQSPTGSPAPGAPPVVSRAEWGADESLVKDPAEYLDKVDAVFVHHTAGTNAYDCAESPAIIRAILTYHVKTNGWNDIGYNFFVDKCGTVFEGRAGGTDKRVRGAHTYGFNGDSSGISVLGDYENGGIPTAAAKKAVADVTAWKLGLDGVDPEAKVTLTAAGDTGVYKTGQQASLYTVSGHRDGYATLCPGKALYSALPEIRTLAANSPYAKD